MGALVIDFSRSQTGILELFKFQDLRHQISTNETHLSLFQVFVGFCSFDEDLPFQTAGFNPEG